MIRSWKILFGAACAAALLSPALAETPAAPAAAPAAPVATAQPAISPAALELLKGMSETLAKSKSLSFNVKRAFEEPASTGQPLFYFVDSTVSLQRPDKFKVVVRGDGPPSEFLYDGKEFAVFLPASNLIAIESAPPNLEETLEAAFDKAGIYFPFVDFIVADPYAAITEKLTSAFVVGKSQVVGGGAPTDIVAIANPNFHAQIWIGSKDKLPRLAWISPVNGKGRALIEFSDWRLNAPLKFSRSPAAAKAGHIKFAKPGASAAPAKP